MPNRPPLQQAIDRPSPVPTPLSAPRGFFGPWVVRAAFVLAVFGWGVGFYGPPIYLHAVIERTAWSLGTVSAAVTLHFLSGALVVANLPRLHARWGIPATIVTGALVTAAGVYGWAVASAQWQLFAAALLSGIGWVTMGAVTVNAVISRWHVRTRPKAMAIAYNGGSVGGVIFSSLWVALISWCGFAGAAMAVGALMVAVMLVLNGLVFVHTPESLGQLADGGAAPASARTPAGAIARRAALPGGRLWRDRAFRLLAIGMALGLFAQTGLLVHLFSLLATTLGARAAGLAMGGATVCAIVGRSAAAHLMSGGSDRRALAAAGYGLQAAGALTLLCAGPGQLGAILLGTGLFGSGLGNATYLPPMIAQSDFAAEDVARVVALVVAIGQASYAFSPLAFGLLLAASGDGGGIGTHTTALFAVVACLLLLAAGCFLARPFHQQG